jgi:SM-20-related protein
MLQLDRLEATPLKTEPYKYLVVRNFVAGPQLDAVRRDFPAVPGSGSHEPEDIAVTGAFATLMDELLGPGFQRLIERKFGLDLSPYPTHYTVRGYTNAGNGKIHTDVPSKVVTVLLYLNDDNWNNAGGRLRILRSGTDLEDFAEEVEPAGGTLLVFQRADNSWHGHLPFEGPRRAVQMNWITGAEASARRSLSGRLKRRLRALVRSLRPAA